MHFKRGKAKGSRAGCLMCKPNKMNGWAKHRRLGHAGFGKLRKEAAAAHDMKEME